MLPVLVTTRVGEFRLFRRWWAEGHRFGLVTVPHKKVRQNNKRGPAVSANLAAHFADFPGPRYLDNGIFAGIPMTAAELLAYADGVNADYVFAPDVFGDSQATLAQAKITMADYQRWRHWYHFALVGVAQGTRPEEYLACAGELLAMGYTHLAVGGLLRRRGDSEKSRRVGAGPLRRVDESLLWPTLHLIHDELDPPWLHVLGALHHERIPPFRLLGVTSADSKQWTRAYTRFADYGRTESKALKDRFVRHFYFQWQLMLPGMVDEVPSNDSD